MSHIIKFGRRVPREVASPCLRELSLRRKHTDTQNFEHIFTFVDRGEHYEFRAGVHAYSSRALTGWNFGRERRKLLEDITPFAEWLGRLRYQEFPDTLDNMDNMIEQHMLRDGEQIYSRYRAGPSADRLHQRRYSPFRAWRLDSNDVLDYDSFATLSLPRHRFRDARFYELVLPAMEHLEDFYAGAHFARSQAVLEDSPSRG